jgi:hypothetical protein
VLTATPFKQRSGMAVSRLNRLFLHQYFFTPSLAIAHACKRFGETDTIRDRLYWVDSLFLIP